MNQDKGAKKLVIGLAAALAEFHGEAYSIAHVYQATVILTEAGPLKGRDPAALLDSLIIMTEYRPGPRLRVVGKQDEDNDDIPF